MTTDTLTSRIEDRLLARNEVSRAFFAREAPRLAAISRAMAERFRAGGRLLAFGRGPYATDAQHVAVEFVHPVIVGKRALPALDVSASFPDGLRALVRPDDIAMGLGPPGGDAEVDAALAEARARGALTLALPGAVGDYAVPAASDHPFVHQEMLEVAYHTLWETVHLFLEHGEGGHDVGESAFLYPFLGNARQDTRAAGEEAAASIAAKAGDDERLREEAAAQTAAPLARAAAAVGERLGAGGQLLLFGNGGSATDANDLALDCLTPPGTLGYRPLPAVSLASEPASLSAVANDVGPELLFVRQLVAHARPPDVAVAFSTSGSSANIVAALSEARRRGLLTVALLGYDGGDVVQRGLADVPLVVACDYIPRIQEIHATLYHVLRELLDEVLHGHA